MIWLLKPDHSEATEFAPAMDEGTGILPGFPAVAGKPVRVKRGDKQRGDVRDTHASPDAAARELGWKPVTRLREGLAAELEWLRGEMAAR